MSDSSLQVIHRIANPTDELPLHGYKQIYPLNVVWPLPHDVLIAMGPAKSKPVCVNGLETFILFSGSGPICWFNVLAFIRMHRWHDLVYLLIVFKPFGIQNQFPKYENVNVGPPCQVVIWAMIISSEVTKWPFGNIILYSATYMNKWSITMTMWA